MSQRYKEHITCPKCGYDGEFECWPSVNVDLNPELRKKIFNDEIFLWTCPKCGVKVFIPFGTIYHDMIHHFMIFFSYNMPDNGGKNEPFLIPGEFGLKDYTYRIVYGLLNFKEKILIMENELNDIAVEKLKYTIIHHMEPSMAENGVRLYFQGVTKPDEENEYGQIVFLCQGKDDENRHIGLPMERYYEQCLSIELDNRFSENGCMCIDEEWMANKMKGIE